MGVRVSSTFRLSGWRELALLAASALAFVGGGCGGNVANDASHTMLATGGGNAGESPGEAGGGYPATGGSSAGLDARTILRQSIGSFLVQLTAPNTFGNNADGFTNISGSVKNAIDPDVYVESALLSDGDCTVIQRSVPTCTNVNAGDGCNVATEVCTNTDTCTALTTRQNVGTVTLSGVRSNGGDAPFALAITSNSYAVGTDVTVEYPGVDEGAAVRLAATGGAFEPFEIEAPGIRPLEPVTTSYTLTRGEPLVVTWLPPGPTSSARIQVTLNVATQTESVGLAVCDVADTGTMTVSSAIISTLLGLGVTGYPRLNVTRRALGVTTLAAGTVALSVESRIRPTLSIAGYTSCLEEFACPSGQLCNLALQLCQPVSP